MAKVISTVGDIEYQTYDDGYEFMVSQIINQMLSNKAAHKIYSCLVELCEGSVLPEKISSLSDSDIRGIGTTNSKVGFIRYLTEAVTTGELEFEDLKFFSDAEVIKRLTSIKGIGK